MAQIMDPHTRNPGLNLDLTPETADFLHRLSGRVAGKQPRHAARYQQLALAHDGLRGDFLAFTQAHLGTGRQLAVLRLTHLRLGLQHLRLEYLGVHARNHLPGLDELALLNLDTGDAPR